MKKLPLSGFARKVSGIQKTLVFSKNDDIIRGNKEVSVLAKKKNTTIKNTTIKEKPTYEELEETIKELKEKLKGKPRIQVKAFQLYLWPRREQGMDAVPLQCNQGDVPRQP